MRHGRSASTSTPNPKLQQALGCLDLRLEDELTRYRRQRAGLSVAPIVLRPKQPAQKPLALLAIGEMSGAEAPAAIAPANTISFNLGAVTAGKIGAPVIDSTSEESAMVPYAAETAGDTLDELAYEHEAARPPEDYLESSEQLLKSLKREEAKVEVERGFLQSLSTPLGIGSMLTLLLSSAMLGYVIMNPTIVTEVWQNIAAQNTAIQEATGTSEPAAIEATDGAVPKSPPLDQEEFAELSLNTLSVLRTKPAPIPSSIASPSPSPSPAQSAPAALVAPAPGAASPQSEVAAASSVLLPPVTVTSSVPGSSSQTASAVRQYYRVETPFTGDQSLEAARQIAPDAFVRPDGKIQLAATVTQAEAQRKAQEFKNRGIAAEVR